MWRSECPAARDPFLCKFLIKPINGQAGLVCLVLWSLSSFGIWGLFCIHDLFREQLASSSTFCQSSDILVLLYISSVREVIHVPEVNFSSFVEDMKNKGKERRDI